MPRLAWATCRSTLARYKASLPFTHLANTINLIVSWWANAEASSKALRLGQHVLAAGTRQVTGLLAACGVELTYAVVGFCFVIHSALDSAIVDTAVTITDKETFSPRCRGPHDLTLGANLVCKL